MEVEPSAEGDGSLADSFRRRVDVEVERLLAERRDQVATFAPEALALIEEVQRLLRAGGKRLRPLFCFWGHRAGGGSDGPAIVRAGAAVEMLHLSALIHDDVMDRSHLRRGEPTSFRFLGGMEAGAGQFGHSAAILAGDLAHALADELLSESGFPPDRVLRAFEHFNRMRVLAVSGEFLDLLSARGRTGDPGEPAREPGFGEGRARTVAALKSGSYSVTGPLLIGAALADAPRAVMDRLVAFGRPLGEAFQLRDDVLGTFGDPQVTGKDRDTDIMEGKHTILVAKARELGGSAGRRLLDERLGKADLPPEQVEEVRAMMRDSGALAGTIELIRELTSTAKSELARLPIDAEAARALAALADLVAVREG
jgi:geranylgeranyl diphosphate synthase type I